MSTIALSGIRNHVLDEVQIPTKEGTIFRVSGPLKSIVKHVIWGLVNTVSCAENGWFDLNDLYVT